MNPYLIKFSHPKNPKICNPILVTLLKMRPHSSQSSRENATPSSSTSPLASYKEVTPPGCLPIYPDTSHSFTVIVSLQAPVLFKTTFPSTTKSARALHNLQSPPIRNLKAFPKSENQVTSASPWDHPFVLRRMNWVDSRKFLSTSPLYDWRVEFCSLLVGFGKLKNPGYDPVKYQCFAMP